MSDPDRPARQRHRDTITRPDRIEAVTRDLVADIEHYEQKEQK